MKYILPSIYDYKYMIVGIWFAYIWSRYMIARIWPSSIWSDIWLSIYECRYMTTGIPFSCIWWSYMIAHIWPARIWLSVWLSDIWVRTWFAYIWLHAYDSRHMTHNYMIIYTNHMCVRIYVSSNVHIWFGIGAPMIIHVLVYDPIYERVCQIIIYGLPVWCDTSSSNSSEDEPPPFAPDTDSHSDDDSDLEIDAAEALTDIVLKYYREDFCTPTDISTTFQEEVRITQSHAVLSQKW